jgi:hypothetical protein
MYEYVFSEDVKAKIWEWRYRHPDPRVVQRLDVLNLKMNGFDHAQIVAVTRLSRSTVCALLAKISASLSGAPITIVLDNAKYQRCALVQEFAKQLNIELLFLQSYSPNLNLIERLWKFVKKEALGSRHHTNFPEFQSRIDDCLAQLSTTHRSKLASLMTLKFQTFEGISVLAA